MAVLTTSVKLRNTGTEAYILGYALQHSETCVNGWTNVFHINKTSVQSCFYDNLKMW